MTTTNDLGRSALHLLHRATQCVDELFANELGDIDLTPRQLAVMMTVAASEDLNQVAVVERTGIDRSTVTDVVRRLKKKGLLERRRRRNDARAYTLRLTGEGERILSMAIPLANRVDRRVLQLLSSQGQREFMEHLLVVVVSLAGAK